MSCKGCDHSLIPLISMIFPHVCLTVLLVTSYSLYDSLINDQKHCNHQLKTQRDLMKSFVANIIICFDLIFKALGATHPFIYHSSLYFLCTMSHQNLGLFLYIYIYLCVIFFISSKIYESINISLLTTEISLYGHGGYISQ